MAVSQGVIKESDVFCGRGREDQEGFQEKDETEEETDRGFEARDFGGGVRVEHEQAGQHVIQEKIREVYEVPDEGCVLPGLVDGEDGNDIQGGREQVDDDHTEEKTVV